MQNHYQFYNMNQGAVPQANMNGQNYQGIYNPGNNADGYNQNYGAGIYNPGNVSGKMDNFNQNNNQMNSNGIDDDIPLLEGRER